jgi:predicted ester cyclase
MQVIKEKKMVSIFPAPQVKANTSETRQLFIRWLEVQEEEFPLADDADSSWTARFCAYMEANVHPDVVVHGVPLKTPGRSGWLDFLISVGRAFPDGQTTYEAITVDGNIASAFWTYRATQKGDFGAIAQTDKDLIITGAMFDRFENGLLVEHWAAIDKLSWLKQLGVLPQDVDL